MKARIPSTKASRKGSEGRALRRGFHLLKNVGQRKVGRFISALHCAQTHAFVLIVIVPKRTEPLVLKVSSRFHYCVLSRAPRLSTVLTGIHSFVRSPNVCAALECRTSGSSANPSAC